MCVYVCAVCVGAVNPCELLLWSVLPQSCIIHECIARCACTHTHTHIHICPAFRCYIHSIPGERFSQLLCHSSVRAAARPPNSPHSTFLRTSPAGRRFARHSRPPVISQLQLNCVLFTAKQYIPCPVEPPRTKMHTHI